MEAGERLGFLPGDMKEKVDPYLRPLYDALYDCMPPEQVERRIASGEIEIAPIAFMRGRTLADAFVILDEAQNTTPAQMKMFLTRFGQNSRMVICGDPGRSTFPAAMRMSGLADAVRRLEGDRGHRGHGALHFAPTWCATRSSGGSSMPMKARTRDGPAADPLRQARSERSSAHAARFRSARDWRRPCDERWRSPMLSLEIAIEAPWPPAIDWPDLAEQAAEAVAEVACQNWRTAGFPPACCSPTMPRCRC